MRISENFIYVAKKVPVGPNTQVGIAPEHIVCCDPIHGSSNILMVGGHSMSVEETPEQVDNLMKDFYAKVT